MEAQTVQPRTGPSPYRWYVLSLLMVVYAFNFLDRQIISILAPYLKADLGVTDAQLGLLYGTTFALFYGVFGIPLARLADGWSRAKTLALGLSLWSLMTAVSGFSRNFSQLGAARIGVGVGEASASPAAISLLCDYFEPEKRGMVLSVYSVGVYVGAGISLMIGGLVVDGWERSFGDPATAPLGLAGWQAAFIAVGLPGLLLGLLVYLTIREPAREHLDPRPFRSAVLEFGKMMPGSNWLLLARAGAPSREIARNLAWLVMAIAAIIVATILTDGLISPAKRASLGMIGSVQVTSNLLQWVAMGIGCYAFASWFQSIRLSDPLAHRLIAGSPAFRWLIASSAFIAFSMYALNAFTFLYATKYLGFTARDGFNLGVISAVIGGTGMIAGGILSDLARKHHRGGRLMLAAITTFIFAAASLVQFMTTSVPIFYISFSVATLFIPMWFGPILATGQDLVIPRLRGVAFANVTLGTVIFGLGLGPYTVGLISDATGSLQTGILVAILAYPAALVSLIMTIRHLEKGEALAAEAG
jgi:MFS family permease